MERTPNNSNTDSSMSGELCSSQCLQVGQVSSLQHSDCMLMAFREQAGHLLFGSDSSATHQPRLSTWRAVHPPMPAQCQVRCLKPFGSIQAISARVCLLSGSLTSLEWERSRDVASLMCGCSTIDSGRLCTCLMHAMKLSNVKLTNLLKPATVPSQLCEAFRQSGDYHG